MGASRKADAQDGRDSEYLLPGVNYSTLAYKSR